MTHSQKEEWDCTYEFNTQVAQQPLIRRALIWQEISKFLKLKTTSAIGHSFQNIGQVSSPYDNKREY